MPNAQIGVIMRFTGFSEGFGKTGRVTAAMGAFLVAALASSPACAAADAAIDGAKLSLLWVLPFAEILGSLAVLPTAATRFWHRNYGLVALFWGLAFWRRSPPFSGPAPLFMSFSMCLSSNTSPSSH